MVMVMVFFACKMFGSSETVAWLAYGANEYLYTDTAFTCKSNLRIGLDRFLGYNTKYLRILCSRSFMFLLFAGAFTLKLTRAPLVIFPALYHSHFSVPSTVFPGVQCTVWLSLTASRLP